MPASNQIGQRNRFGNAKKRCYNITVLPNCDISEAIRKSLTGAAENVVPFLYFSSSDFPATLSSGNLIGKRSTSERAAGSLGAGVIGATPVQLWKVWIVFEKYELCRNNFSGFGNSEREEAHL